MKKGTGKGLKVLTASALLSLTLASSAMASSQEGKQNGQLVPLRYVAESIGAKVEWDNAKQQAIVLRGPIQLIFTIGQKEAVLNQERIPLSAEATIIDHKTMVPLDVLNQVFNAKLNWDEATGIHIGEEDIVSNGSYFVHLLQTEQWQQAHGMLNESMQKKAAPEFLQMYFTSYKAVLGTPEQLVQVEVDKNAVHQSVKLLYQTKEKTPFGIAVRFDAEGKVDDLFMPYTPSAGYQKPSYDNPDKYVEKEVVIGEGEFALPGTLTLPKGEGPFPVVVLVHGSGTNDRDESIGAGKPFRDLAVGLAAQNIAVLRYEKRTLEHNLKSALHPHFTVKEETVDDALAAVKLLKQEKQIDPDKIFVIGHSQGGMLVPKILEQDQEKSIAGAVIMAGPSIPLEDLMLIQFKNALERAKAAGQPTEAIEQQIQSWEQFLSILKDPQYSVDHLPEGVPSSNLVWWYDFRNYHGPEIAKNQSVPLFIIQGENDVQVPAEHLEDWKKALAQRNDVSYKLYPKLNHLFIEYDLPSTGMEYYAPGNVPAYVIEDIANWMRKQK